MNSKVENAIGFLAKKYNENTSKSLSQTFLYKLLAFFDYTSLKETGIPSLRLKYNAWDRGPVPVEIYEEFKRNKKYSSFEIENIKEKDYEGKFISPKEEPDLDHFNQYEINLMRKLVHQYGKEFINAGEIPERSHESILSWKKAYQREKNSKMLYEEEFQSLEAIPEEAETFLIYEELAGL